jgi:transcription initiation factor IIE alpha subunit
MIELIDDIVSSVEKYGESNEYIISICREMFLTYMWEIDDNKLREEIKLKAQKIIDNDPFIKKNIRQRKLDDLGI